MTMPLAFITGASSGIGQALAARYYRGGYRLALVARRTAKLASWSQSQGFDPSRFAIYGADVCDIAAITGAGRACIASQGLPDVVIANAGISIGFDTAEYDDLAVMQRIFATNNVGMAATFQPFVRAMCRRGSGTMVGISSVSGVHGLPGHGAYCSSKAAVINYCESLRGECLPHGVKVVTLLPGYIATPLTRRNRYSMPFLMKADVFADKAFGAIENAASYRIIPWQMGIIAKLMQVLPNFVVDRALLRRGRKPRVAE
jgi:short-subunit dehydrogenase